MGRGWSIAAGKGERLFFLERWIKSRSSNCLGTDLDSRTELCRLSAVDCNTAPFGRSILSEYVVVRDGDFRVIGGLAKTGFRHG